MWPGPKLWSSIKGGGGWKSFFLTLEFLHSRGSVTAKRWFWQTLGTCKISPPNKIPPMSLEVFMDVWDGVVKYFVVFNITTLLWRIYSLIQIHMFTITFFVFLCLSCHTVPSPLYVIPVAGQRQYDTIQIDLSKRFHNVKASSILISVTIVKRFLIFNLNISDYTMWNAFTSSILISVTCVPKGRKLNTSLYNRCITLYLIAPTSLHTNCFCLQFLVLPRTRNGNGQ